MEIKGKLQGKYLDITGELQGKYKENTGKKNEKYRKRFWRVSWHLYSDIQSVFQILREFMLLILTRLPLYLTFVILWVLNILKRFSPE